MRSTCYTAIALALGAACSAPHGEPVQGTDGVGRTAGDRRLFVPEGLGNTNLDGADVGLVLVALTLVPGTSGASVYAAVRNDDVTPACNGGLVIDFLDDKGYVFTSTAAGLQGGGVYRLPDGPTVTCLQPGEIAMAASMDLPDVVIDRIGALQHQMPYFILDGIVPLGRLRVSGVQAVASASGSVFRGTMTNGLEAAVTSPRVSVFPLNAVGRPLGVATATATTTVPAGGTWTFETTSVTDPGVATEASAAASIQ